MVNSVIRENFIDYSDIHVHNSRKQCATGYMQSQIVYIYMVSGRVDTPSSQTLRLA